MVFLTEGEIKWQVRGGFVLELAFQILTADVSTSCHFIANVLLSFLETMNIVFKILEFRLSKQTILGDSRSVGELIGSNKALGLWLFHFQSALERTIIISWCCLSIVTSHLGLKLVLSSNWTYQFLGIGLRVDDI